MFVLKDTYKTWGRHMMLWTEGDYLDVPFHLYSEVQITYSMMARKRQRALFVGSLEAAKSRAIAGMQAFKGS